MPGPVSSPDETHANALFERLASRRMLVVSGKGGVGRTSIAAMLGVALAERGKRVLVATTGHDDRLAWMLGLAQLEDQPQAVTDRLFIQRLEPQTCIREYGGLVLRSSRMSSAVFDNRVIRKLMRAIPGLDDFAVVGKAWHEAIRGGQFDCVIFDGPATGHLLFALDVPLAILNAVPKGPLTKEAELMQKSFEDPKRVEAVLVGLPETWPLTELAELGAALRTRVRMSVAAIMVNGLWPDEFVGLASEHDATATALQEVARVSEIGRQQREAVARWQSGEAALRCGTSEMLSLPWQWGGLTDLTAVKHWMAQARGGHLVGSQTSG